MSVTFDQLLELQRQLAALVPASEKVRAGGDTARASSTARAGAAPDGDSPFDRVNALPIDQVARWLGLVRDDGGAACPRGCHERGVPSSVVFLTDGRNLHKCSHATCAEVGPRGGGVRTCVDLVAEAKGLTPKAAVKLLANEYGVEIKPKRPPKPQPPGASAPWHTLLRMTDKGGVATSMGNVTLILERDARWQGVLGYDARFGEVRMMRKPPVAELAGGSFPRSITDADVVWISKWIETELHTEFPITKVHSAIDAVAHQHAFDRVSEYLEGLVWDSQPRLDSWIVDLLGAEDTRINRAYGAKWMIGGVARALDPGCKVDHVLVLEGEQGRGKSRALAALAGAPEWFCDRLPDLRNAKDAAEVLQGPWIIEMGELDAISKAEATTIKSFLTAQADRYRPAYGRRTITSPRRCVFAATTNESSYLRDGTGGRRFWPVRVTAELIDVGPIEVARDQLWAEAVHRYRLGEAWHLDDHALIQLAVSTQEERYHGDEWEPVLESYLVEMDVKAGTRTARVSVGDCLRHLGFGKKEFEPKHEQRVGKILRRLDWIKKERRDGDEGRKRYAYEPSLRWKKRRFGGGDTGGDTGRRNDGGGGDTGSPHDNGATGQLPGIAAMSLGRPLSPPSLLEDRKGRDKEENGGGGALHAREARGDDTGGDADTWSERDDFADPPPRWLA